jgi:hypothetical protein
LAKVDCVAAHAANIRIVPSIGDKPVIAAGAENLIVSVSRREHVRMLVSEQDIRVRTFYRGVLDPDQVVSAISSRPASWQVDPDSGGRLPVCPERCGIGPRSTVEDVVTTGGGMPREIRVISAQEVVPRRPSEGVIALISEDRIALASADQGVVAIAARDAVVSRAAADTVSSVFSVHRIFAGAACNVVPALAAQQPVITRSADESVGARSTGQEVGVRLTAQSICAK